MPSLNCQPRTAVSKQRQLNRKAGSFANGRGGAVTIEMAMVAPFVLFLILIFTSIESLLFLLLVAVTLWFSNYNLMVSGFNQ